ncbi:MAG: hypothetical protein HY678_10895 [Chloroflexi bacterium]|nr:hypothetical protein [Chloroflexota bacterium]
MRAVTDAGPLIHLSWLDRLDLFHLLFDEVIAPAAVLFADTATRQLGLTSGLRTRAR